MSPMPSLEQVSEKVMRMSCDEQTDIEDFFLGSRVTEVILCAVYEHLQIGVTWYVPRYVLRHKCTLPS